MRQRRFQGHLGKVASAGVHRRRYPALERLDAELRAARQFARAMLAAPAFCNSLGTGTYRGMAKLLSRAAVEAAESQTILDARMSWASRFPRCDWLSRWPIVGNCRILPRLVEDKPS